MSEFIPASDLISVKFVKRLSPDTRHCGIIEEFILVRSHTGVIYVVPPSIKPRISRITQKSIPVKSHTGNISLVTSKILSNPWLIYMYILCTLKIRLVFSGVIYARSAFPIVSRSNAIVRFTRSMVKRREIQTRTPRLTHNRPMRVISSSRSNSNSSRSKRSRARWWSWTRPPLSQSARGRVKQWCSKRSTSARWPSQSLNDSAREYLSGAGKERLTFLTFFKININEETEESRMDVWYN